MGNKRRKNKFIVPLTAKMRRRVSPDMVIEFDFGDPYGVKEAISLRDWALAVGITDEQIRLVDESCRKHGIEPLFGEEEEEQ